jgi:hypothetical protein
VKVLALVIVLAGLVIAIVPQATNCEAQGGTMPAASTGGAATAATWDVTAPAAGTVFASAQTTAVDTIVPKMKCLWSARGGLAVGITLAVVGGLLFFARRKETRRALGIVAACLGLFTILLPTTLIGTCGSSAAVCNTTMKPLMLVAGGIALVASLAAVVVNELKRDVTAEALAG